MVVLIFRNPTITLACACCLHKVMQEYQRLAQKSFLQRWKKLFYHPRWLFLMHYSWEVGVKLKQINILKVKETQQIWRAYMSLSLLTEVYDETCNPPSTHNFCKIKFIQYNQIRYKIKNLLSCLGCEGKRWLPLMVLYWKWSVPVSFIITAHSQVSKWGKKKVSTTAQTGFFFTFVIFVPGLNA